MIKNKSTSIFYLSLLLIPIGMFSKTWLPGSLTVMGGKETIFIIFLGSIALFLFFDLQEVLLIKVSFYTFEKKILLFLFFIFIISIAVFNSHEFSKLSSISFLLSYIILILVFFYIFPQFFYARPSYFEKFIKIVSNFGLLFALFGLTLFVFNLTPIPEFSFSVISLINHPNNTSIVFTMSFIPTLFYIYWKWNNLSTVNRIYYILSFIIQIIAQLFTYTRAGLIATAAGLLIFWLLYYRSKIIFIIPIFVIVVPFFGAVFFQAKGFASFVSRFYLLIPAFQMIFYSRNRMLWGYGITNSLAEYKKNLVAFNPSEYLINDPHNTYITLILMLGIIFTFSLLFFVLILLLKCLKKVFISKRQSETLFYIFLFSSTISILIQGLFDAELIKADFYTIHYLLILLGLIYSSNKLKSNKYNFFDQLN